jgi:hypothetical protein
MRIEQLLVQLGERVRIVRSGPFSDRQRAACIRQPRRPAKRQTCLFRFTLKHRVHGAVSGPDGNAAGRNVRVRLERQLDDVDPVPHENRGSVLPDVAEGAEEVVPMKNCHATKLTEMMEG